MEGDYSQPSLGSGNYISIHSPRMEGDFLSGIHRFQSFAISIHSLRMEGDESLNMYKLDTMSFQSTPSAWRETGSGN